MGKTKLNVTCLAHTPNLEEIIAMSARLCYSGATIESLSEKTKEKDQADFIHKLMDMNHLSPIEHVSFTFGIEGVSRALLAQITRHRIASFSVQSQRYVDQTKNDMHYIMPPSIEALGEEAQAEYHAQMQQMQQWYEQWCERIGMDKKEDARFVLPNACETRMIVTMNVRELLHFFQLRCCERAQWEIKRLAWVMLGMAWQVSPVLFDQAGPSCIAGACSEGKMSCNHPKKVQAHWEKMKQFMQEHKNDRDLNHKVIDFGYDE